ENLRTELQQVETQIRQTSPRYAALTQPQPLTLAEIQTQALDADTLLLEYALGKDRSYLWLVTTTAIKSYELPKRTEIEAAAREFYLSVSQSPQASANDVTAKREIGSTLRQQAQARSEQAAARLSRMLLAPAATLLGKKRLLIVADGALQFVPFAALPELSSEGGGAKPPLIVEHEIVSLPSASTLAVLKRKAGEHKATTKTLAVLADPVFERADERFKTHASQPDAHINMLNTLEDKSRDLGVIAEKSARESGLAEMDLRIPRLPATRREADAISALAPPHARLKVLDFAANRGAATDPALADYRFVHFATHGFINSQHPELSGIMFSMFNEQGQAQDGFLRTHEVFNLKLNADVVVLSACQTGLGKEVKGEGLVGLTRGFMYAGVPRVVVSLWSVNDEVTAELMTRFYKGMLTDKLRPAQALQAAQASMLREPRYSAPFYWAAFTLQGEWR
ncbi:MAG: CHAT domain-containing protein, partial [Chitinophagaceae bacterium]